MRALFFLWIVQGFAAFNLTWGIPAVNLDSNPASGDTDLNPTLAIDPLGNAVATWGRTSGHAAIEDIWAASYNHSSRTWTGAMKISGGGTACNSQVVMDEEGNATFIWEEGFPTQILSRTLSVSGVWSPPLSMPPVVVNESVNAQTTPQIGVDGSGNALLIWQELVQGVERVFSARKLNGESWTSLGEITSGLNQVTLRPQALAINHKGDAIAVWQETNQSKMEIHGAQYIDGAWRNPLMISSLLGTSCQTPAVGIDDLGNSIIVWNQENLICAKRMINNSLSPLVRTISNPAYPCKRPVIGVDKLGNAVVVFERYDSMHKFIAGVTFSSTEKAWSSPTDISGPSIASAEGAGYPVFSFNSIGDGVVIWKEYNGTNMVIQGAGFSLGTWSFTKTLSQIDDNAGAPYPAYDISVAVNGAGNIIAIWPEDPSGNGSQQIKATSGTGLANAAPPPPLVVPETVKWGIATGVQILHRYPAHGDLINILSWDAPGGVDHYNIYRGSSSNLIGSANTTYFEDHQRIPKQKVTYLITSVDSNGQESCPTTLVVHPQ